MVFLSAAGIPGIIFSGFLSISAYRIGKHYYYGLGTEKDYAKAAEYFQQPPTQEINTLNTPWLDYTCTVRVSRKILRLLMFITMLPQKKETPMRCTSLRKWSVTALGQI